MIKFSELKKFFVGLLIVSLVIAAGVAVVTVLIGDFNDLTSKVLTTLFIVVAHSLVSLLFIWDDARRNTFERLSFFINVAFTVIMLSFFTSLFGIWELLSGEVVWETYNAYFIVGFAALHANLLAKATGKAKYMDTIILANYFFIVVVASLLGIVVFTDDATGVLGEMYFRILGALAIIDGTLSILTMIFYKLYMHKHPEAQDVFRGSALVPGKAPRHGLSVWVIILLLYIVLQVVDSFIFGFGYL